MKNLVRLICVLILLFINLGYPQQDSVLSYLPLQIGNQWQYRVHYVVNNSSIDTTYYSLFTVSRDTIMPNGFQYKVLESAAETKYIHIDSATACVYEYEGGLSQGLKTDSLRCSEGDWFGRDSYCRLIDTATVLKHLTKIMAIERIWPDISEDHTLAMDIGISNRIVGTSYGFGSTKTFTLVYANVNGTEFGELVTSIKDSPNIINDFDLYQNYPNPFNPGTKIKYSVPGEGFVSLKVYDVLGNEIATLINEEKPAGNYEVEFDANGLPSGIYFYQLKSNKYIETKKMNLLK